MTTTLVWDPSISQALNAPENSGQEGSEILGNFLYATDLYGSDIDIYEINPADGTLSYLSSYGTEGAGPDQFGAFSPLDVAFYTLSDGSTKAYTPDAGNDRIAALNVDVATGELTWDASNTLQDPAQLTDAYGLEINGNYLYSTDWGASNIDIYEIDPVTGALSYVRSFGSEGTGINQFSAESPLDISFLELENGQTKAYVPDSQNQRVVVLNVNTQTGELTWDAENTLPNGTPGTNQFGIEIHEGTLYVNKYDVGILLYDIDLQTGALTFSHSVGTEGSGDAQFKQPIDTSFYQADDGTVYAYVTDSDNRRITGFTVEPDLTVNDNYLLHPGLNSDSQLTLSIVSNHLPEMSEVVVISTDTADGSIDGLQVTDAGYLAAAQERSQFVFSTLDHDSAISGLTQERIIDVSEDEFLNFAVIKGGSLQDALLQPESVEVVFGSQMLSEAAATNGQDAGINEALLNIGLNDISEPTANGDSGEGIVLSVGLGDAELPIGSSIQTGDEASELIDLTEETGTLAAEFSVYREADFDSVIGFFAVENADGQIRNQQGSLLSPGEAGYIEAAIRNRLAIELSGENGKVSTYRAQVEGGQLLSSFIVSHGSIESLANGTDIDNADVFFVHTGANSDNTDHVKLLGDNTFGFEDTAGGGDQDFNDLVVKARFS
ncbi:MAG: DUF4114 domain-containing protein [Cyanobacteria bacterium J06623_4]